MRLFLFTALLVSFSSFLTAQMEFTDKPFEELLAQAKTEDKVIFIDAYTTWCGPCKMMSKNVFPDKKVGAVYNKRFINAKIDMEKGEGPALAQRYGVAAYPTYLFVDGDGEIVHRGVGYIPQDAFIELAQAASGPNSLGKMNARYDEGERDEEFIETYVQVLTDVMDKNRAGEVVEEYLANKEDWSEESTANLLVNYPGKPGSKQLAYLLENAAEISEVTSTRDLMMSLQQVFISDQMRQSNQRMLPNLEVMQEYYERNAGDLAKRLGMHYATFHAERTGDMKTYLPAALAYYQEYPSNDFSELNSVAWNIFENSDDENHLKIALGWARQSVEIDANYPNLDTLAWLYKKMGDDQMAEATARRAIELAKETGQDFSDTERIFNE